MDRLCLRARALRDWITLAGTFRTVIVGIANSYASTMLAFGGRAGKTAALFVYRNREDMNGLRLKVVSVVWALAVLAATARFEARTGKRPTGRRFVSSRRRFRNYPWLFAGISTVDSHPPVRSISLCCVSVDNPASVKRR